MTEDGFIGDERRPVLDEIPEVDLHLPAPVPCWAAEGISGGPPPAAGPPAWRRSRPWPGPVSPAIRPVGPEQQVPAVGRKGQPAQFIARAPRLPPRMPGPRPARIDSSVRRLPSTPTK